MRRSILTVVAALAAFCAVSCGRTVHASLEEGFSCPESRYRPRTWWHWMNGNVTEDGIRKDLEWLHDAGIAGVTLFDASHSTPTIVEERRTYMSDGWKDALSFALDLADSLGMDIHIASSPGWSLTGGPWVSEEDAQKKLVWSEMKITGGSHVSMTLPAPPSVSGPYQDEPAFRNDPERYRWYRDICVLALRTPAVDSARVVRSDIKAGFRMDYTVSDHFPTPETDDFTALVDVIDLSGRYVDGILDWDAPEGDWTLMRFGCSLIGHVNGPAPAEATGLEVDKLDRGAVRRYFENYLSMYSDAVGGRLGEGGINGMVIDSYESGKGTWTAEMEAQFAERRGYELRPWLPVLAGRIIGSAAQSERFLFDWRKTLGELIAENHYDLAGEMLHSRGMVRYSESHEERTSFTGDGMAVKRGADVPMSAFWVRYNAGWYSLYPGAEADLRESSSVAHIYGQNVCAAESFTTNGRIGKWDGYGAYKCHPGNLKRVADAAMAEGLNRFVMHTCVHQPVDDKVPGLSLSTYGQWFTRHDTWAAEAHSWTDYLSRSCFMLQQGRNVADIAWFYGEDKNVTGRYYDEMLQCPRGWNYDFVGGDALLNALRVQGGRLVSKSGAVYRIFVIDNELRYISLPVLRKIALMAKSGIAVCGPRPEAPAGLMDAQPEFEFLVREVWDGGRNNVIEVPQGCSMAELRDSALALLSRLDIREDVAGLPDSLSYVHRKLPRGHVYWLANICSQSRKVDLSFDCSGYEPEIWHADTGLVEAARWSSDGHRTTVSLDLERDDAQFVVMVRRTMKREGCAPQSEMAQVQEISGPWTVELHQKLLDSKMMEMDTLSDLSLSDDPYVRYYSGTAVYRSTFSLDPVSGRCWIDLGRVCNMARVKLNGQDLGLAWKSPFRLEATSAVRPGENEIEIRVTNSWSNRLIGDARGEGSSTWTPVAFYRAEDKLDPAGLIGPVIVLESGRNSE